MDNASGVWVRTCGPLMWGRVDAEDEGWTHNGKLIRFARLGLHHSGVHLYTRRACYALYWNRRKNTMAKQHFIVCMRDTEMRLIGPFESADALRQYAATNNPSDDPRWQGIQLDADDFGEEGPAGRVHYLKVYCYAPTSGPMPA